MSAIVAPCILAETSDQYKEAMGRIHSFATRVHIDISDGEFAPTFLVGPDQLWWQQGWHADIHAMVARPSEYVDQLIALKADLIKRDKGWNCASTTYCPIYGLTVY